MCDGPPVPQRGPGDAHSVREWIWERDRYEARQKGIRDYNDLMYTARQEGHERLVAQHHVQDHGQGDRLQEVEADAKDGQGEAAREAPGVRPQVAEHPRQRRHRGGGLVGVHRGARFDYILWG